MSSSSIPPQDGTEDDTAIVTPAKGATVEVPSGRPESVERVGERISDRYVVIEQLGVGGMGRVLRAYDHKLQREVALKQLRAESLGALGEARLLREARAMAQLSHTNVVAVYDVDIAGAEVTIAMELVVGQTASQWLEEESRDTSEIIAMFVEAGRGIAAAHRVPLVHRDFKPQNILISTDGQVKVTDFGLAKATDGRGSNGSAPGPEATRDTEDDQQLTEAGTVMGTPRYMAPEQHLGEPTSAASDQYAFCVALWEALARKPPFSGPGLGEAKLDGPPVWDSGAGRVSASIIGAVRRGLAPEPEDRWPSMDALLDVFDVDRGARWRRWALGGVVVGVVGGGGLWLQGWLAQRAELCTGAQAQLDGVWDQARRSKLETAILGSKLPFAPAMWKRVGPGLDDYAADWVSEHTDACEATTLRAAQSAEVMDLRMACLARAKGALNAAVDVLARADPQAVEKGVDVVAALPSVAQCGDLVALRAEVRPPDDPAVAKQVEDHRAAISHARTLEQAGAFADARQEYDDLGPLVDATEYAPLRAELLVARGRTLVSLGLYDEAEAALREGLALAVEHGAQRLMVRAASRLTVLVGYRQGRPDEGVWLGDLAVAAARRTRDTKLQAKAYDDLGLALYRQGRYEDAEGRHRRALALYRDDAGPDDLEASASQARLGFALIALARYDEAAAEQREVIAVRRKVLGDDHPNTARAHSSLATTLFGQGLYPQAEAEHRKAAAVLDAALGPKHPDALMVHSELGNTLHAQGRFKQSEAEHRRLLELRREVLGDEHPDVGVAYSNLGLALQGQGRAADAEAAYRAAVSTLELALGRDHEQVAMARDNLGLNLHGQDRNEEAVAEHRRALEIREDKLGSEHPAVAATRGNMAYALDGLGKHAEAEHEARTALRVFEKSLGPEHPEVAISLHDLGVMLRGQGKLEEARGMLERALKIRTESAAPVPMLAETEFALAQVLWDQGDKKRALRLANSARKGLSGPALVAFKRWRSTR